MSSNGQNLKAILRKSQGSIPKLSCLVDQKSILRHYCTQNATDGIQTRVHKMNNESVIHFNPSISVKVKKVIRQPVAQFRDATCDTELQDGQTWDSSLKYACGMNGNTKNRSYEVRTQKTKAHVYFVYESETLLLLHCIEGNQAQINLSRTAYLATCYFQQTHLGR